MPAFEFKLGLCESTPMAKIRPEEAFSPDRSDGRTRRLATLAHHTHERTKWTTEPTFLWSKRSSISLGVEQRALLVEKPRSAGADQRADDEEPDLAHSARVGSEADQRGADRARGIDRGSGDVDADEVNRGKGDPMARPANPFGMNG